MSDLRLFVLIFNLKLCFITVRNPYLRSIPFIMDSYELFPIFVLYVTDGLGFILTMLFNWKRDLRNIFLTKTLIYFKVNEKLRSMTPILKS